MCDCPSKETPDLLDHLRIDDLIKKKHQACCQRTVKDALGNIQTMPADAGVNGIFIGNHATRWTAYEGASEMGYITEPLPKAPHQSDNRLRRSTYTTGEIPQPGRWRLCLSHGLESHT